MRALSPVIGLLLLVAGCSTRRAGSFAELDRRLDAIKRDTARQAPLAQLAGHRSRAASDHADERGDSMNPDGTPFALSDGTSSWSMDESAGPEADAGQVDESRRTSGRRPPMSSLGATLKRDLRDMPGGLWQDTKAVYGSAPNLVILGLTYGGSLALQETGPDETVEHSYRHHSTFSKSARDTFNVLGNPALHFALAGTWYLFGQQTQNDKTYEVGKTLFSALIINGVSTMVGQTATWDDAPNGEWGTFPSGHTSSAFTFASVMHEAYGPLVGVPLYGLGALVAMSRLEDGEHYLSDVVMGGVMGLVIGHTVAGEHEFELFGGKVLPYMDPHTGSSGIAWVKELKRSK